MILDKILKVSLPPVAWTLGLLLVALDVTRPERCKYRQIFLTWQIYSQSHFCTQTSVSSLESWPCLQLWRNQSSSSRLTIRCSRKWRGEKNKKTHSDMQNAEDGCGPTVAQWEGWNEQGEQQLFALWQKEAHMPSSSSSSFSVLFAPSLSSLSSCLRHQATSLACLPPLLLLFFPSLPPFFSSAHCNLATRLLERYTDLTRRQTKLSSRIRKVTVCLFFPCGHFEWFRRSDPLNEHQVAQQKQSDHLTEGGFKSVAHTPHGREHRMKTVYLKLSRA